MTWKLFLDDERYPVDPEFYIARNFDDAVWLVMNKGFPIEMSLDHDLGSPGNRTGMDFVKWLVAYFIQEDVDFPDGFSYTIHSQNPVGAKNMRSYMEGFMKSIE